MAPDRLHLPAGLGLSGSTLHFSLSVSDIDRSLEFFRQVLGYELQFVADDLTDEIARITGRPGLVCRLVQLDRKSVV